MDKDEYSDLKCEYWMDTVREANYCEFEEDGYCHVVEDDCVSDPFRKTKCEVWRDAVSD